jgi:hypothetical protein
MRCRENNPRSPGVLAVNGVGLRSLPLHKHLDGKSHGSGSAVINLSWVTIAVEPQSLEDIMDKYCRICWNSKHWRYPTGEAQGLESPHSFVHDHGFGVEEWLFEFSWLQPGPVYETGLFKYAYLNPISKHRKLYEGQTFSVLLYTITPEGRADAVAVINHVFVPDQRELDEALAHIRSKGWIQEMEANLEYLRISSNELLGASESLINVRFRPSDVTFFDRPYLLSTQSVVNKNKRYEAFNWDGAVPSADHPRSSSPKQNEKRQSEAARHRAAIAATTYDPTHSKLQNALYDYLCKKNGRQSVHYEKSYVDITSKTNNETCFYEIKTAPTVKGCIRDALGQLLEYAIYPSSTKADKLIVVGDCVPNREDIEYLSHLRGRFRLPLYYQQWLWHQENLGAEF